MFCEAGICHKVAANGVSGDICKLLGSLEQFQILFLDILVWCVVSRQNYGDILSQLQLSLPTATKVPYGELLKNNKFLQFVSILST